MSAVIQPAALPQVPLWIDGRAQPAATQRFGEVFDPARGAAIRLAPLCEAPDVERAVSAAERAYPAWRDTPPLRRARILMRFRELLEANKEALARLVVEEHGKTLEEAIGSVRRGIEVVEFATGIPHLLKGEFAENVGGGDCVLLRQPLGVCAGITPFSFPVMVPLWTFPVALACGNAFVLKPSEKVPSASLRMAELLTDAGLPPGVFNVIHGDRVAVDALLAHPLVKAVSFVGSMPVARHIYETGTRAGKRVQALGGAKNHAGGGHRAGKRQSLRQRHGDLHARRLQSEIEVGMVGINVPIPVPMAFFSCGVRKASLCGDLHAHGPDGVRFYTRGKVVTTRWPEAAAAAPGLNMPTLG